MIIKIKDSLIKNPKKIEDSLGYVSQKKKTLLNASIVFCDT
jgi:hypothetical protein